jgi:hypothetical protein
MQSLQLLRASHTFTLQRPRTKQVYSELKRVSVKGLHEEDGFGWDVVEEVL